MLAATGDFVRQTEPEHFKSAAIKTGVSIGASIENHVAGVKAAANDPKTTLKRKPHPKSLESAERWDGMS